MFCLYLICDKSSNVYYSFVSEFSLSTQAPWGQGVLLALCTVHRFSKCLLHSVHSRIICWINKQMPLFWQKRNCSKESGLERDNTKELLFLWLPSHPPQPGEHASVPLETSPARVWRSWRNLEVRCTISTSLSLLWIELTFVVCLGNWFNTNNTVYKLDSIFP